MRYSIRVGLLMVAVSAPINGSDEGVSLKASETPPAGAMSVPSVWDDMPDAGARPGVNENRGNWFFKAQILKKAINPVKEVQRVVKDILPYEKIFAGRYESFTSDLAAFYQDYGFQDADVVVQRTVITEEIALNEQRLRQPVVPVKRDLKTDDKNAPKRPLPPPLPNPSDEIKRLKINQTDVEKLAKLMTRVRAIENAATQAIQVVSDLVKNSREFETGAWRDYEKISDTLSDVVAEDRYRAIEAALSNAQSVKQYCAETFESFFSGLVQELTALEQEIKTAIDSLRARGYGFGKLAIEKLDAERKAAEEAARLRALKAVKKPEPISWWGSITGYFSRAWHAIINGFRTAGKAIMGLFGY